MDLLKEVQNLCEFVGMAGDGAGSPDKPKAFIKLATLGGFRTLTSTRTKKGGETDSKGNKDGDETGIVQGSAAPFNAAGYELVERPLLFIVRVTAQRENPSPHLMPVYSNETIFMGFDRLGGMRFTLRSDYVPIRRSWRYSKNCKKNSLAARTSLK